VGYACVDNTDVNSHWKLYQTQIWHSISCTQNEWCFICIGYLSKGVHQTWYYCM
jgi:hypothetical protein